MPGYEDVYRGICTTTFSSARRYLGGVWTLDHVNLKILEHWGWRGPYLKLTYYRYRSRGPEKWRVLQGSHTRFAAEVGHKSDLYSTLNEGTPLSDGETVGRQWWSWYQCSQWSECGCMPRAGRRPCVMGRGQCLSKKAGILASVSRLSSAHPEA